MESKFVDGEIPEGRGSRWMVDTFFRVLVAAIVSKLSYLWLAPQAAKGRGRYAQE